MKRFTKNSAERKRVRVDFTDWLDGSETLSTVQFFVVPSGMTIISGAIDTLGGTSYGETYGASKSVIGFADGGASGVTYTVTARVVTSIGQIKDHDFQVSVE